MNLAFSILSHRPPGKVFLKLLDFLVGFENAVIVIHHDYSQSIFPEDIIEKYHLQMINNYNTTAWGHVSKVPAVHKTFLRIAELMPNVDWVITLSPNCYPVKSHKDIESFLAKAEEDIYMDHDLIQKDSWEVPNSHFKTLFTRPIFKIPFLTKKGRFYWRYIRKNINIEETPFNSNYLPYCGSDWMMFNRKVLNRIVQSDLMNHPSIPFIAEANDFPDRNASPVEIILQSFIMNQKDLKVEYNYHRFINWKGSTQWHPNILDMTYFDAIKESPALFGRKFNDEKSLELLERLDKEILYVKEAH
jgi:Core-2/I-Branching enzyme